jgi:hypothetical protein
MTKMKETIVAFTVAAAAACSTKSTPAAPQTVAPAAPSTPTVPATAYSFSGTVNAVGEASFDSDPVVTNRFSVGDSLLLTISLPQSSSRTTSIPSTVQYFPVTLSVTFGDYSAVSDPASSMNYVQIGTAVSNQAFGTVDTFNASVSQFTTGPAVGSFTLHDFQLSLIGDTTLWSSLSLPNPLPPVSAFRYNAEAVLGFTDAQGNVDSADVQARITSATVTSQSMKR